ncbi:MAG: hypothetical protein LBT42_09470 [Tannerella sp.]|jgi:hypothetical protein|nr:hypothetical protein [Tannerella sp.]
MNKKKLKLRPFLSVGTFFFLISLVISGIVIHVTDHQPYTFTKIYCMVLHNISALCFLVFSAGHVFENWKSLRSYISGTAKRYVSVETLIVAALMLAVLLICRVKTLNLIEEHGITF